MIAIAWRLATPADTYRPVSGARLSGVGVGLGVGVGVGTAVGVGVGCAVGDGLGVEEGPSDASVEGDAVAGEPTAPAASAPNPAPATNATTTPRMMTSLPIWNRPRSMLPLECRPIPHIWSTRRRIPDARARCAVALRCPSPPGVRGGPQRE